MGIEARTLFNGLPREGEILLDWSPTEADRVHEHDELAERFIVFDVPQALSGLVVYGLFNGIWVANPSDRPVIRELLRRLKESAPS